MFKIHKWQSTTAAILTLGMTASAIAPIAIASPALAQYTPSQTQRVDFRIPSGTRIRVKYDSAQKIVVSPKETAPLTLTVSEDIVSRDGTLLIPTGSQVVGELQPASGGSQFIARDLVLYRGERRPIDATSNVVTKTEEIRKGTNLTSILAGAAVGSAAAAAIAGLTGDRRINPLEILAGTGAGSLGGLLLGRNSTKVVVIDPDTDLDLTLRSDLVVSSLGRAPGYNSGYSNPTNNSGYDSPSPYDRGI